MMDFIEGSKLTLKNDERNKLNLATKVANSYKSIIGGGSKETDLNTSASEVSEPQKQQSSPFQTQFRLKPLSQPNTKNTTLNDLCDDSSPFINLKIEKKLKVEKVPIKFRALNKFDDLTITSINNRTQNWVISISNSNIKKAEITNSNELFLQLTLFIMSFKPLKIRVVSPKTN